MMPVLAIISPLESGSEAVFSIDEMHPEFLFIFINIAKIKTCLIKRDLLFDFLVQTNSSIMLGLFLLFSNVAIAGIDDCWFVIVIIIQ